MKICYCFFKKFIKTFFYIGSFKINANKEQIVYFGIYK